jgi:Putative mono-oxygenase ydhR
MITAIVQFELKSQKTVEEAAAMFESSAPKYVNLKGLIRKYYIISQDGTTAGGVYLWKSIDAANQVYSGEWRERVTKLYGSEPSVTFFHSPVIVDNLTGETLKSISI